MKWQGGDICPLKPLCYKKMDILSEHFVNKRAWFVLMENLIWKLTPTDYTKRFLFPDDCLDACQSDPECQWFTYNFPTSACFLFSDCELFDETCSECISGQRNCEKQPVSGKQRRSKGGGRRGQLPLAHNFEGASIMFFILCCALFNRRRVNFIKVESRAFFIETALSI